MIMRQPAYFRFFLLTFFISGFQATGYSQVLSVTEMSNVFDKASGDFQAGKYQEAANGYEQLVRSGRISPELYFNLGTAKYRLDQNGEAILWMKRALVVDRGMPEAKQSLTFLRSRFGMLEFAESRLDRIIGSLPATFGWWTSSLMGWISITMISLSLFVGRLKDKRSLLVTIALLAAMAAFVASRVGHYRTTKIGLENVSIITGNGVSALTAPVPEAKSVVDLPPGSEVKILRDGGGWHYAEIPGNLRGWIRKESFEPIWPLPLLKDNS